MMNLNLNTKTKGKIVKKITLGVKVKEIVTGFTGVVTGHCEYLTGCDTYLVAPPLDKEGKHRDGRWFDVNRLEITDSVAIQLPTEEDKGAMEEPPIK